MRKTIVTCDRCSRQGTDHAGQIVEVVEVSIWVDGSPVPPIKRDLCPQCVDAIKEAATETLPRHARD